MADNLCVYVTTVSSSQEIKKHQTHISNILSSKKVEFSQVDICSDPDLLAKMREIVQNPKAVPPQICRGDTYLGDYEAFNEAVENKDLSTFLKCEVQE